MQSTKENESGWPLFAKPWKNLNFKFSTGKPGKLETVLKT